MNLELLTARRSHRGFTLIDLTIALSFALGWLITDARKRGITAWPYVVASIVLGSPAVLVYAIRRSFVTFPNRQIRSSDI